MRREEERLGVINEGVSAGAVLWGFLLNSKNPMFRDGTELFFPVREHFAETQTTLVLTLPNSFLNAFRLVGLVSARSSQPRKVVLGQIDRAKSQPLAVNKPLSKIDLRTRIFGALQFYYFLFNYYQFWTKVV